MSNFAKILGQINAEYSKFEVKNGFNGAFYKVFHALFVSKLTTQRQIVKQYGLAKQTANKVVLALLKEGLVAFKTSSEDGRQKQISLTLKGYKEAVEFLERYENFENKAVENFGEKRAAKLLLEMEKFLQSLEQSRRILV